jgi:predicted flap endonuclease-1-like 5' DNA nuclease
LWHKLIKKHLIPNKMATKKVSKSRVEQVANNFKSTAKNIHDEALKVSDELVEGSLATGAKWQKIMAKALTEGTELFGKQQEFLLDTLEEVKGQYLKGNKRFMKLIGFEFPEPRKVKKAIKAKTKAVENTLVEAGEKVAKKVKAAKANIPVAKSDDKKDDLKQVDGVGPKIESLLHVAGIFTFETLASTSVKDLQEILEAAGPRFRAQDPSTWRAQAKRLAK